MNRFLRLCSTNHPYFSFIHSSASASFSFPKIIGDATGQRYRSNGRRYCALRGIIDSKKND
jgi:hypothetical protein